MNRVNVRSEMLRWACERAGYTLESAFERFPNLPKWESGQSQPTLKQLERFARSMRIPIGYLFLPEPIVETAPVPDFRTVESARIGRPSPDLLDTIYVCQQRQEWYRSFSITMGDESLPFVGSVSLSDDVVEVANRISEILNFNLDERRQSPTWGDSLRRFIHQADDAGILVMVSGIVGSNTHRKLNPEEFRGFALSDEFAPLVFINGADTKAAQMFTLAHEIAHIWLGQSGISNPTASDFPSKSIERWCNGIAAELLVPLAAIRREYQPDSPLRDEVRRLARRFKVSTLVIIRRVHDIGALDVDRFHEAYNEELARLLGMPGTSGGDFYLATSARVSRRFARAVVLSTLEGQTLYRDAFRMLGLSKVDTFNRLGRELGVA